MSTRDEQALVWWEEFQARCFNNIPVGRTSLLGDRFKIMVQNPFTEEWEDVWKPKAQPVPSSIAEIPQSAHEP